MARISPSRPAGDAPLRPPTSGIGGPSRHDPVARRRALGERSLASLHALRERLLPDLERLAAEAGPPSGDALAALLARHVRDWVRGQFPADELPLRILWSNIAAFVAHAIDGRARADRGGAEALWAAWFAPASPVARYVKRLEQGGAGDAIRYQRTICCLRDNVEGVARCCSCPKNPIV